MTHFAPSQARITTYQHYVHQAKITTAECCTQILWLRQCLEDIQVNRIQPTPIYCDNTSDISISKNLVMH